MNVSQSILSLNAFSKTNQVGTDAAFFRVEKIDLSLINNKLVSEQPEKWTPELIERSEYLYRRFLVLHAIYPQEDLVPTTLIDEYWHQHILDTKKYASDCEFLFGQFLHHDPYFGINGEADRQRNKQAFSWTKSLWQSTFGEPLLGEAIPCKATDCR